jgi:hypothetical protein
MNILDKKCSIVALGCRILRWTEWNSAPSILYEVSSSIFDLLLNLHKQELTSTYCPEGVPTPPTPPSSGFRTMLNCALKTHKNTALPCHHNSNCKTTVQNETIVYCFETLLKNKSMDMLNIAHLNMMDIAKWTNKTDPRCRMHWLLLLWNFVQNFMDMSQHNRNATEIAKHQSKM